MRLPFSGGGYIEQKYTLHEDSYRMDNLLSFVGMGDVIPGNVSSFDIDFNVTVPRMEKGYRNESQYSKLNYYYEGDKKPEAIGNGRNGETPHRLEAELVRVPAAVLLRDHARTRRIQLRRARN